MLLLSGDARHGVNGASQTGSPDIAISARGSSAKPRRAGKGGCRYRNFLCAPRSNQAAANSLEPCALGHHLNSLPCIVSLASTGGMRLASKSNENLCQNCVRDPWYSRDSDAAPTVRGPRSACRGREPAELLEPVEHDIDLLTRSRGRVLVLGHHDEALAIGMDVVRRRGPRHSIDTGKSE